MKNRYGNFALIGVIAASAALYAANKSKSTAPEEIDEYVKTDQLILIKPLTTDIRVAPQPIFAKGEARSKRGLASSVTNVTETAAAAVSSRSEINQAYRNTLLVLSKNAPGAAKNVQAILDYVNAVAIKDLPVTQVVKDQNGAYQLAAAVDVAKIREPQFRKIWRHLSSATIPTSPLVTSKTVKTSK